MTVSFVNDVGEPVSVVVDSTRFAKGGSGIMRRHLARTPFSKVNSPHARALLVQHLVSRPIGSRLTEASLSPARLQITSVHPEGRYNFRIEIESVE